MEESAVRQKLVADFDVLSGQLRQAARYVLDHPREVALLSMRKQAREAGVQPATMTRLAQRIGLDGYESIRTSYAAALRRWRPQGFSTRAGAQVERQRMQGDLALAGDILDRIAVLVAELGRSEGLDRLEKAARTLSGARRVYCIGMRYSHAIAWQLHYILSMIGDRSVLLDGPGGTGVNLVGRIEPEDALLAVSVAPYTRATVEIAGLASTRGAALVVITDSEVSPLARMSRDVILVTTDTASFLHTMAPAFVVVEILGALIAGHEGERALAALEQFDAQAGKLGIHLQPQPKRKASGS